MYSTFDLTTNSQAYRQRKSTYRAVAATMFSPGMLLQFAALDKQIYGDISTVQLPGIGAGQTKLAGFVDTAWPGFSGSIGAPSYLSPSSAVTQRGTSGVDVVLGGFHPAILLDQSGAGAATVTDGIPLIASRATAGYVQGVAVATGTMGNIAAVAALPSTGLGSSLTAGALAQALQTATIAGAPAVGDTLSVTIQSPYSTAAPGVAQTITYTTPPLTTPQAVSATTAAAALVAYLNAQASFSQYFTAANAAGVVTITVNALSNPFALTFGSGSNTTAGVILGVSGMMANSLTFSTAATGGSTNTAGGANFAGGTGYKGPVAAFVMPSAGV